MFNLGSKVALEYNNYMHEFMKTKDVCLCVCVIWYIVDKECKTRCMICGSVTSSVGLIITYKLRKYFFNNLYKECAVGKNLSTWQLMGHAHPGKEKKNYLACRNAVVLCAFFSVCVKHDLWCIRSYFWITAWGRLTPLRLFPQQSPSLSGRNVPNAGA